LHEKLFFTEKEAIFFSFHLKNTDEVNWGYKLNYPKEYDELKKIFEENIKLLATPLKKN